MAHECNVVPAVVNAGDPCAQDESLPFAGNYGNYQSFCGYDPAHRLGPAAYAQAESAFNQAVQQWLAGRCALQAVSAFLPTLGVQPEAKHDRRGLLVAPVVLGDDVLADVAEDWMPDAGVLVERVTGDPFSPPSVAIFAVLAWAPELAGPRAVDAWAADEPERPLVHAMRAIERAPPCVYVDGVPALPLPERMTPPGGPTGCYVARAYPVGSEWAFSTRLDLPARPDTASLARRLLVELWRLRTKERRASWEDVLRQRPLTVYRAAYENAQGMARRGR